MKTTKRILLTFMLLFCFSTNIFAEEKTADVNGKYNYSSDNFYDYNFENNKINVIFDDISFDITTDNNSDNGLKLTIIPTKDNALSWLDDISNLTNIKGYYFLFTNKPLGNIKISVKTKEKVMENISTEGKILTTSETTLLINNKSYVVFGDETMKNTINFKMNGNGSIIIDGTSYQNDFTYQVKGKSIDLIIKPNSMYEIDSIVYDSLDVTNLVKGGFLTITDLKEMQDLIITFKEKIENQEKKYYKIVGTLTKDGVPLANAMLELYSDVLKTTTDKKGNFIFENVQLGSHRLTAYIDNKVVGYMEFILQEQNQNDIDTINDDNFSQIMIGNNINGLNLMLNIDNDYKIQVDSVKAIDNTKEGKNTAHYSFLGISVWIWIAIIILLVGSGIIILKKRNNK